MTFDDTLESLLDIKGVATVFEALERVALDKADYVAAGGSHGDPSPAMATQWRRLAVHTERAADAAKGL